MAGKHKKDQKEKKAAVKIGDVSVQRRGGKRRRRSVHSKKTTALWQQSHRHMWLYVLLFLVMLCLTGWKIWRSDAVQMRFVYMWPYQNEILTYARLNNLDPFLVAAVIKNESEFKPGAVSPVGAVGLMQIMPETGEWIAKQMGIDGYSAHSLYKPDINIRMGCWYLSELKYEFRDNLLLMIMAYNAGRGNTEDWMRTHSWDYTFGEIREIPYPESRDYVAAVLYDRDEYYRLYKDKVQPVR